MIATVMVTAEGDISATIDSDEYPADEDDRKLMGLRADDLLAQAGRQALATWLELRDAVGTEDES